jgi:phosphatidate cytidylyltransferase
MAFNRQVFITRTVTAIVFATVMLLGLLWNQWSFLILFSIIHFGCWWEYLKLTEKIYKASYHIYTKLGFMLVGYAGMLLFCGNKYYQLMGYGISKNLFLPISAAGFILLITGLFRQQLVDVKAFAVAAAGAIYISLSIGILLDMWQKGINWCNYSNLTLTRIPVVIIVSIWVNDTMAYVVGSLTGKTPLSKISPKKTWEGTIGGILLAVAVTGFLLPVIYTGNINWPLPLFFGLVALISAIAGTFGDLLESKLKRMAGVKDSGSIMPGHGGFLDRFDSMLLATPAVWLYVHFFMH